MAEFTFHLKAEMPVDGDGNFSNGGNLDGKLPALLDGIDYVSGIPGETKTLTGVESAGDGEINLYIVKEGEKRVCPIDFLMRESAFIPGLYWAIFRCEDEIQEWEEEWEAVEAFYQGIPPDILASFLPMAFRLDDNDAVDGDLISFYNEISSVTERTYSEEEGGLVDSRITTNELSGTFSLKTLTIEYYYTSTSRYIYGNKLGDFVRVVRFQTGVMDEYDFKFDWVESIMTEYSGSTSDVEFFYPGPPPGAIPECADDYKMMAKSLRLCDL